MHKLSKKASIAALAMLIAGYSAYADAAQQADPFTLRFATPQMADKPLTRWWVPGAKMSKAEIQKEIQSMVDAGFGGAEIVPVSLAGGDGQGEIDWGSEDWKELTKYILQTAGQYDFTIDFTMTPAWPLSLPTIQDVNDRTQGAQMELDGAWVDGITKENPFDGPLPVSSEALSDVEKVNGEIRLVGVSVAKYVDKEKRILSWDSAKSLDISQIPDTGTGNYAMTFVPEDEGEYVLYAWYQHPSGNQKYGNNQIDHYSLAGTQMITDYWRNELIPYYGGTAWKNCRSLFIDSLEFETHLDWTYDLPADFQKAYGYDVIAYLPALYDASTNPSAMGNYMGDPVPSFSYDKNTEQIRNDYKENLTQLYINNHIKPLEAFCNQNGVTLRYQTAYGKNLEVGQTAMYPDIPETESLYGKDYLDFYRLQSGAVHATDKNIYSLEAAAEWTETWNPKQLDGHYGTRGNGEYNSGNYEQTFQDHLWHDQRAYAAGVNQVVFHGYPYSGLYKGKPLAGITWPGFTGFEAHRWSNSWGERQPNWLYADTYTNYLSRTQFALRQGTPKVDLAVYRHSYYETIDFWNPDKIFNTELLEQSGYSYDFVSPALLELGNMKVTDGLMDADGSAYKALIFNNQQDLPYETAQKLKFYARQGLPLIFIGGLPTQNTYTNEPSIQRAMADLAQEPNVHQIASISDIKAVLQQVGIEPAASYESQPLLTAHRQADYGDIYYIYNSAGADNYREIANAQNVQTEISLSGQGLPYLADAWTGKITPIEDYRQTDTGVTLQVDIAPNDANIIILSEDDLQTPTAKKDAVTEPIAQDITITDWNLKVESWRKGSNALSTQKRTINMGRLPELVTWDNFAKLENVSGIGEYTAIFHMDEDYQKGQQAYLHVAKCKDAFGVEINGKPVVVNQVSGIADVTDYLEKGKNNIKITVATSLLNAVLRANANVLNEDGRVLDDRQPAAHGLNGEVYISPNK